MTHQDADQAENLFLLGRFDEALDLCHTHLQALTRTSRPLHSFYNGEEKASHFSANHCSEVNSTKGVAHLNVPCKKRAVMSTLSAEEQDISLRLVVVLVQALFELQRHDEAAKLVLCFYGNLLNVPFPALILLYAYPPPPPTPCYHIKPFRSHLSAGHSQAEYGDFAPSLCACQRSSAAVFTRP